MKTKFEITYTLFFTSWGTRNNISFTIESERTLEDMKSWALKEHGPNLVSVKIVEE
jgi:hypothetical protein